ncbi:hypothetical protein Q0O77_15270, partial [Staphylococcus aureus]|nr:hypothetical protein [Staphylococcus aureus]
SRGGFERADETLRTLAHVFGQQGHIVASSSAAAAAAAVIPPLLAPVRAQSATGFSSSSSSLRPLRGDESHRSMGSVEEEV